MASNEPPYFWQQAAWSQWTTKVNAFDIPHALLVQGPYGLGQVGFAKAAAQQLLCEHHGPCGQCRSCLWWQAGGHPDFCVIKPEKEAGTIKIEAIRSLIPFVNQTSHTGGHRVILLHPAEKMTESAANALLKTLEEPPQGAVFLLIAYQPHYLPLTVKSRCQALTLAAPAINEVSQWLAQQGWEQSEAMARLSQGLPLLAQEQGESALQQHAQLVSGLKALANHQVTPGSIIDQNAHLSVDQWLVHLQNIVIDAIRLFWPQTHHYMYQYNERANLRAVYQHWSQQALFRLYDQLITFSAQAKRAGTAINKQLFLEQCLLSCAGCSKISALQI